MQLFLEMVFFVLVLLAIPSLVYLWLRRFSPKFFRRLAYEVHLWLGIISGLILFVVCLSGTILVFKTEIIQFLEQDRYFMQVPKDATPKPIEELIVRMEKTEGGKVVRIAIPEQHNKAWIFNIRKENVGGFSGSGGAEHPGRPGGREIPKEVPERMRQRVSEGGGIPDEMGGAMRNTRQEYSSKTGQTGNGRPNVVRPSGSRSGGEMQAMHAMLGTAYLVNPYTGESLGPQRSKTYMFFISMQFLHRFLWLDIQTGQIIVGGATIVFIVLAAGGLLLWFPPKLRAWKAWLMGLKVRTQKGWGRFLYDTHNTLGFYALIPLMIMALTGPVISFAWYRNATGKVLGTKPFSRSFTPPVPSDSNDKADTPLAWENFLAKSDEISSRQGVTRLSIPQSPNASIMIQKTGEGFCRLAATDKIQFDRNTGEVLKNDMFDKMNFGEKVSTLIFPLHNGEIFGTVSKCVYFLTCLIATTLPLTGVILWVRKLLARRKKMKLTKEAILQIASHDAQKEDKDIPDYQLTA